MTDEPWTRTPRFWSREEDLQLTVLWRTRRTTPEISREMGRSHGAIESRAAVLKLGSRRVFVPTREGIERAGARGDAPDPTDTRDAEHVALALAGGGFPPVRMAEGKPVWVWPKRRAASAVRV